MKEFFDKVVTQPLRDVFQKLVAFLPNLLTGIIVFRRRWISKYCRYPLAKSLRTGQTSFR